jgi:hypothetical protein
MKPGAEVYTSLDSGKRLHLSKGRKRKKEK